MTRFPKTTRARTAPNFCAAAFLLAACLGNDGDTTGQSSYDRASERHEVQFQKWQTKGIESYQYQLIFEEDFMSDTFSGTCRVTPDTSYCELKNFDGEIYETHSPLMAAHFEKAGAAILITPPGSIISGMEELYPKATLFLKGDSLAYFFTYKDTTRTPPQVVPYFGVEVRYDSEFGFPVTVRELPIGPYMSVSGFTVLTPE